MRRSIGCLCSARRRVGGLGFVRGSVGCLCSARRSVGNLDFVRRSVGYLCLLLVSGKKKREELGCLQERVRMLGRRRRKEGGEQALYILSEVKEKNLGLCVNWEVEHICEHRGSECYLDFHAQSLVGIQTNKIQQ